MNRKPNRKSQFATCITVALFWSANAHGLAQGWPAYGHDPQHSTTSSAASQIPQLVRWSTPVDLNPQYSGPNQTGDLYIHYGTPVITSANTVLLPVKTGASGGFQIEARSAAHQGALLWAGATDYTVPNHDWFPICGVTLTPNDAAAAFPGAGGTVLLRTSPDSASGSTMRRAFYGLGNYTGNETAYNNAIQICTPISSDGAGNLYFGYVSTGAALPGNAPNYPGYPNGIPSGLARLSKSGGCTYVSAAAMCGDSAMQKVCYNCAPAFSADGTTLYVVVNNGSTGYLCALNSTTLTRQASVLLRDPISGSPSWLNDDSSATPTVGPDGDVYYGVLESPGLENNFRGWLLHFSGDLATSKLPAAFGWDDTASVVPVSAVPAYAGPSSYLLLIKYNNYANFGNGGGANGVNNGVNRLALVDPNTSFVYTPTPSNTPPGETVSVMNPFLTVAGVTPDDEFTGRYPNAVREWCINSAAVDPINRCAVVNSEDGNVYRWDFTKATASTNDTPDPQNAGQFIGQLSPALYLAPPTGEAYTPTVIGPDGAIYAINNATLFSGVSVPLTQAVIDPRNHALIFTYLRALSDATYTVETSTDLVNWTTAGVNQGSGSVGDQVVASVPLGPETKRFVRLSTSQP